MEGVARLACFELWGGNSQAAHPIELPGLLGWICCTPFGHTTSGGDVHYVSVCSKGQVSRIALADVAGHGGSASSVAERLRHVLQHHSDNWDQSALMRELNEAFQRDAKGVQFATAVVLGFYFGTGELLFTNAGHLPLLWHHAVAAGFVLAPVLKVLGAFLLTASLVVLAILVFGLLHRVPQKLARRLLAASASSVIAGMILACVYAVSDFAGRELISIPQMALFHGTINGLGFALCGLLGWTLVFPEGLRGSQLQTSRPVAET